MPQKRCKVNSIGVKTPASLRIEFSAACEACPDTKSEVEREFCKRLEMPEKSKPTSGSRFVGVDC
jgi:hypothetical protein